MSHQEGNNPYQFKNSNGWERCSVLCVGKTKQVALTWQSATIRLQKIHHGNIHTPVIKNKRIYFLPVQTLRDLQVTGNWCGRSEHLQRIGLGEASCWCRNHLLESLGDVAEAGAGHYGAGALATSSSPGWWRLEGSTFTSGAPTLHQPIWQVSSWHTSFTTPTFHLRGKYHGHFDPKTPSRCS